MDEMSVRLDDLQLTESERKYLAAQSRNQSWAQDDSRYWESDPKVREGLKRRWRQIADTFHSDPYGKE